MDQAEGLEALTFPSLQRASSFNAPISLEAFLSSPSARQDVNIHSAERKLLNEWHICTADPCLACLMRVPFSPIVVPGKLLL